MDLTPIHTRHAPVRTYRSIVTAFIVMYNGLADASAACVLLTHADEGLRVKFVRMMTLAALISDHRDTRA